jgi:hypothetical protein
MVHKTKVFVRQPKSHVCWGKEGSPKTNGLGVTTACPDSFNWGMRGREIEFSPFKFKGVSPMDRTVF